MCHRTEIAGSIHYSASRQCHHRPITISLRIPGSIYYSCCPVSPGWEKRSERKREGEMAHNAMGVNPANAISVCCGSCRREWGGGGGGGVASEYRSL